MKKMNNRICALIMVNLLLISLIFGCSANQEIQNDSEIVSMEDNVNDNIGQESQSSQSPLEAVDYEGENLTILAPNAIGQNYPFCEIYTEGENGETINDAVYIRNSYIIDKYNINLNVERSEKVQQGYDLIKISVTASEAIYDFSLISPVNAFNASLNGYLRVIDNIPHIDKTAPWWSDYFNKSVSVNDVNYFLGGDINIGLFAASGMVYFNKTVHENNGIEDLYALVENGKFTIEKFDELCRAVTQDLNGDGIIGNEDIIGLRGNTYSFQMFLYGLNEYIIKKDDSDKLFLDISEGIVNRITRVIELMNNTPYIQQPNLEEVGFPAFLNDLALFLTQPAYQFSVLRDMQSDYGLLPLPKYDESQTKYFAQIHTGWSSAIVIPITLPDERCEMTGRIIEDMAYSSSVYVRPAFYDKMLLGKYTRDNESEAMLKYIFGNIVVDPIYLMEGYNGIDFDSITRTMSGGNDTGVVSFLESKKEAYQKAIENINASFK